MRFCGLEIGMREERFVCSIREALRLRDPPRVPVPTVVIGVVNKGNFMEGSGLTNLNICVSFSLYNVVFSLPRYIVWVNDFLFVEDYI